MRRAGGRGVLDSGRSLAALLTAMVKHPFGIHDWVDELEAEWGDDGVLMEVTIQRACWLCLARDYST